MKYGILSNSIVHVSLFGSKIIGKLYLEAIDDILRRSITISTRSLLKIGAKFGSYYSSGSGSTTSRTYNYASL